MIDLHTHTKYSRHAEGEIEDIVLSAVSCGVKILAITDHAPYPDDKGNRLQCEELTEYCQMIECVRKKYMKQILILSGLEMDYAPEHLSFIQELIMKAQVDYVIGSVHTIDISSVKTNIWEIDKINNAEFIDKYFMRMAQMISSGLFDAVAHPDAILLGGVPAEQYECHIKQLAPLFLKHDVAYEVNTACMRKEKYVPGSLKKIRGHGEYLGVHVLPYLVRQGVSFSIGSDAHSPLHVGNQSADMLSYLQKLGGTVVYYANRNACSIGCDAKI